MKNPISRFKLPPFHEFASKEITETGVEFYRAGILKPPFPKTEFETEYVLDHPALGMRDTPVRMWISIDKRDDDEIAMRLRVAYPDKTRDEAGLFPYLFVFSKDEISLEILKKAGDLKDREKREIANWAFHVYCTAVMVIHMKHFEHRAVVISERLNRARLRNKKPPLYDHIVLCMKTPYKQAYLEQGGGYVKPHWRRGHLRELQNGKVVPVQPCMVNWNGESIEPKDYVVRA